MVPKLWRLLVALGGLAVLAPAGFYWHYRSVADNEAREVATLQVILDSLRAELRTTPTSADSTRLTAGILAREEGIGRRVYHVARNRAHVDQYWEVSGLSTLTVAAGLVCLIGGLSLRRRRSGEGTSPEP